MDDKGLRSSIESYFLQKGFALLEQKNRQLVDLCFDGRGAKWAISLCGDQIAEMDYLKAFESGMQALISWRQTEADAKLAIALSFESTLHGETKSYRRALNKYSNSIVFEDLGIHLFFVREKGEIEHISPNQVNLILGELNTRIAAQKSRR